MLVKLRSDQPGKAKVIRWRLQQGTSAVSAEYSSMPPTRSIQTAYRAKSHALELEAATETPCLPISRKTKYGRQFSCDFLPSSPRLKTTPEPFLISGKVLLTDVSNQPCLSPSLKTLLAYVLASSRAALSPSVQGVDVQVPRSETPAAER